MKIDSQNSQEAKPPEHRTGYKRRTILINNSLQLRYTLLTLALVSLACFMVWWETYCSLSGMVRTQLLTDPLLMTLLKRISVLVFIKVFLLLTLVALFSIMISHYFAGPIFRIEKSLQVLQSGDLTHRIRLRKRDALKQIGTAFNKALDFLHDKAKEDSEKLESSNLRLLEISKRLNKEEANQINEVVEKLKTVGKSFKLNERAE